MCSYSSLTFSRTACQLSRSRLMVSTCTLCAFNSATCFASAAAAAALWLCSSSAATSRYRVAACPAAFLSASRASSDIVASVSRCERSIFSCCQVCIQDRTISSTRSVTTSAPPPPPTTPEEPSDTAVPSPSSDCTRVCSEDSPSFVTCTCRWAARTATSESSNADAICCLSFRSSASLLAPAVVCVQHTSRLGSCLCTSMPATPVTRRDV